MENIAQNIRGAMRLLYSNKYDQTDYLYLSEVINLDEGPEKYDPLPPWMDLSATRTGIEIGIPTYEGGSAYGKVATWISPPQGHELIVGPDRFSVVVVQQLANGTLRGHAFLGVSILEYAFPRAWRGEATTMKLTFGYDTLETIE